MYIIFHSCQYIPLSASHCCFKYIIFCIGTRLSSSLAFLHICTRYVAIWWRLACCRSPLPSASWSLRSALFWASSDIMISLPSSAASMAGVWPFLSWMSGWAPKERRKPTKSIRSQEEDTTSQDNEVTLKQYLFLGAILCTPWFLEQTIWTAVLCTCTHINPGYK